jgi:hypothetical protein
MVQCLPWTVNGYSADQEILRFDGTRRFVTVFTETRYWILFRVSPDTNTLFL